MSAIRHILVPTDFSEYSASAFKHACILAAIHGAEISALHIVTLFEVSDDSRKHITSPTLKFLYYRLQRRAAKQLRTFVESNRINQMKINLVIESGFSVAEEIFTFIATKGVDFVIAGTQGRGALAKLFLGSVAEKLIKVAPCPVMVVRADSFVPSISDYQQLLVGVDFSENSIRALKTAIDVAKPDATIHVMHIIEDTFLSNYSTMMGAAFSKIIHQLQLEATAQLQNVVRQTKPRCKMNTVLEVGAPVESLVEYAEKENIDLIFLGAKGILSQDQPAAPMGRIPERVIRKAKCPVIVVK